MERKERLNKLNLKFNGGPGSGNFNPGQGRGVGKPDSKTGKFVKSLSPSLKMSENSKKFYEKLNPKIQESFEKCVDRLKKTNISLDNVELEFVNSNTSGGDNGWVNVVDGDNIDSKMIVNLIKPVLKKFTKKEQDVYKHSFVADNSSEAIIDHEFGHIVMYKKAAEIGIKPKSAHLFAEMIVKNEAKKLNIDLNDKSTENFSEYAHRNYTEFIAEAYSRPDYSKLTQNVSDSLLNNKYSKDDFKNFIMEFSGIQTNENNSRINRLVNLEKILNGGPGSGNFNPGQGQGVGKPSKGGIFNKSESQIKDEWNNIDDNVELDKDTEKFLKTYYFGSWFFGNVQRIARQKNIDIMNSFEKKQATKTMETLDNLIDKSSLSKDITLFRGITMTDDNANSIKKGSIISDSGFASSTVNPNKAIVKRGRQETGGKRNTVLMKIDAKKGQKALKSPVDTEYEFVLPRNSKFKVKSVSEPDDNNIRIVEVEYE